MNLVEFLKNVDGITSKLDRRQMAQFIHETARTLPESEREAFLTRLTRPGEPRIPATAGETDDLEQKAREVMEQLEAIDQGRRCLYSVPKQPENWYDPDESFEFTDPAGVLGQLEEAAAFVHLCADREKFQTAWEIGRFLLEIEVSDLGGFRDYQGEPVTLKDLILEKLLHLDLRTLTLDVLYAAYLAVEPAGRPRALYELFDQYLYVDLSLEDVLQYRQELPDSDAFLTDWIDYLGQQPTPYVTPLLQEAVTMTGDPARMLAAARNYCPQHPGLYRFYLEYCLKSGAGDPAALLQVGKEALARVDPRYVVRSETALLTARLAQTAGEDATAEECWLEAFRSRTNAVNFFRLLMESRDFSRFLPEVKTICSGFRGREVEPMRFHFHFEDLEENDLERGQLAMLEFLCGEFRLVTDTCMNPDRAQGWSSAFFRDGIAAFLLLMLRGNALGPGCRQMRSMLQLATLFTVEEYNQGLTEENQRTSETDADWFWTCFCRWKTTVSLSEQGEESCLQWIEEQMEERAAKIMESNCRSSYGECAAFLAAIGEVRESRGETGAKQKVLLNYRGRYNRRTSFLKQLRVYGMMD